MSSVTPGIITFSLCLATSSMTEWQSMSRPYSGVGWLSIFMSYPCSIAFYTNITSYFSLHTSHRNRNVYKNPFHFSISGYLRSFILFYSVVIFLLLLSSFIDIFRYHLAYSNSLYFLFLFFSGVQLC